MPYSDFPTWFGLGSYGGLACTLLASAGITIYALLRQRGSSRQLARSVLACLLSSVFMLGPIWWDQNRLELYGPSLSDGEVLFWLVWTAILGWLLPLRIFFGYLLHAESLASSRVSANSHLAPAFVPLDDPARDHEPLGPGVAWGQLIPLTILRIPGEAEAVSEGHPIELSRQLTVLGREQDCDIVIEDPRASRHHAEIYWDHGRVQLLDFSSMNGTLVNRQAVRGPVPLVDGDILDLGAQRYRFAFALPADQPISEPEATDVAIETKKVSSLRTTSSPEPPPLIITGLSVNVAGETWIIDQPVTTLGRERSCPICVHHDSVSRLHAQIVRQQVGYFLSDLGSSNGTYLNGELLSAPSLLRHGDVIRIGAIELQCDQNSPEASRQTTIPLEDTSSTIAQTV
jgi:pSer/pThr/pTyr-binding forkhead associated (FHA) protein